MVEDISELLIIAVVSKGETIYKMRTEDKSAVVLTESDQGDRECRVSSADMPLQLCSKEALGEAMYANGVQRV